MSFQRHTFDRLKYVYQPAFYPHLAESDTEFFCHRSNYVSAMNYIISLLITLSVFTSTDLWAQPSIKIKYLQNKLIVSGEINGRKAYFLLDTGSDLTLVHENKAKYYNFRIKKMNRPHPITGAGGNVSYIDRAGDIELKLGSLPVATSFFSYDLSGIIASIYNKIHIKISGIIGSDVMGKYGFVIDYRNQEVHYDESFAQAITPLVHKEK